MAEFDLDGYMRSRGLLVPLGGERPPRPGLGALAEGPMTRRELDAQYMRHLWSLARLQELRKRKKRKPRPLQPGGRGALAGGPGLLAPGPGLLASGGRGLGDLEVLPKPLTGRRLRDQLLDDESPASGVIPTAKADSEAEAAAEAETKERPPLPKGPRPGEVKEEHSGPPPEDAPAASKPDEEKHKAAPTKLDFETPKRETKELLKEEQAPTKLDFETPKRETKELLKELQSAAPSQPRKPGKKAQNAPTPRAPSQTPAGKFADSLFDSLSISEVTQHPLKDNKSRIVGFLIPRGAPTTAHRMPKSLPEVRKVFAPKGAHPNPGLHSRLSKLGSAPKLPIGQALEAGGDALFFVPESRTGQLLGELDRLLGSPSS